MPKSYDLSILILGGTGIIGKHLVASLSGRGHRVSVLSRGLKSRGPSGASDEVEHIVGDLRDPSFRTSELQARRFDAVIDLLSFTPDQLDQGLSLFSGKCNQYILVSSATVYAGSAAAVPITEHSPLTSGPWGYPHQKIRTELHLRAECARTGQNFTIVRPYITYSGSRVPFGPWETEAILCRIQAGLPVVLGEQMASTKTSLTHSADLAEGISALVGADQANNQDFIIASEETVTWASVYQIAADVLNVELDLRESPESDVASSFPHLQGKLSDRLSDREFRVDKLRAIAPGFRFEYTVRSGFEEVIPQLASRDFKRQDPATIGGLDRLLIRNDPSKETRRAISGFNQKYRPRSTGSRVHYFLGQHPRLRTTLRELKQRFSPPNKSETY